MKKTDTRQINEPLERAKLALCEHNGINENELNRQLLEGIRLLLQRAFSSSDQRKEDFSRRIFDISPNTIDSYIRLNKQPASINDTNLKKLIKGFCKLYPWFNTRKDDWQSLLALILEASIYTRKSDNSEIETYFKTKINQASEETNIAENNEKTVTAQSTVKSSKLRYYLLLFSIILISATYLATKNMTDEPATAQKETVEITPLHQYWPGDVVQMLRQNTGNELAKLIPPEKYLQSKACYPALTSKQQSTQITNKMQLLALPITDLDEKIILLPDLTELAHLFISHKITLNKTTSLAIPKGEFNEGIAASCLNSIQNVRKSGNAVGFYSIIKQSFTAATINYEIIFDDKTTVIEKAQVLQSIQSYFSNSTVIATTNHHNQTTGKPTISSNITITGPTTVAYIAQTMHPVVSTDVKNTVNNAIVPEQTALFEQAKQNSILMGQI